MMRENVAALFMLYFRPVAAISKILDHGRLWFAIVAALGVSLLLQIPAARFAAEIIKTTQQRMVQTPPPAVGEPDAKDQGEPPEPVSPSHIVSDALASWIGVAFLAPLAGLAFVFVPVVIFVRAVSGYGSFSVLMRSDYLSMLMCALMTWAAAYLPLTVVAAAIGLNWTLLLPLFIASNLYFAVLATLSIRSLLGIEFGPALGLTLVGCIAAIVGIGLSDFAGPLRYFMMSPLILYFGYAMFRSEVRSLGDGLRGRQHFQQQLQIATNNPRDSDAHYQLGLIYQKRRQYSEAVARFEKAIEIDPTEADAQLQLGTIAREQGRFDDAIRFLTAAARLNDKLSSSEVWRELGAAYVGASRFEEAAAALQKYTDRRSYDPEGLYWYGKALAGLGRDKEAREMFKQCVEAVDTMPKHRRAEVRKWKGLALKG